jgi:rhodanese-related sulfurtransferase
MKLASLFRFLLEYVRPRQIATLVPQEVYARLGEADFFVFDCNTLAQWQRGHIPGAIYVGLDPWVPAQRPPAKQATLVFYCAKPS